MLYWIYQLTEGLNHEGLLYKLLNVFKYQTFRAAVACLFAFLLIVLTGEWVIRRLISLKVGQPIRTAEEVHKLFELHGRKKRYAHHGWDHDHRGRGAGDSALRALG